MRGIPFFAHESDFNWLFCARFLLQRAVDLVSSVRRPESDWPVSGLISAGSARARPVKRKRRSLAFKKKEKRVSIISRTGAEFQLCLLRLQSTQEPAAASRRWYIVMGHWEKWYAETALSHTEEWLLPYAALAKYLDPKYLLLGFQDQVEKNLRYLVVGCGLSPMLA